MSIEGTERPRGENRRCRAREGFIDFIEHQLSSPHPESSPGKRLCRHPRGNILPSYTFVFAKAREAQLSCGFIDTSPLHLKARGIRRRHEWFAPSMRGYRYCMTECKGLTGQFKLRPAIERTIFKNINYYVLINVIITSRACNVTSDPAARLGRRNCPESIVFSY